MVCPDFFETDVSIILITPFPRFLFEKIVGYRLEKLFSKNVLNWA
jgi:hypothetical protein